eukprot:37149-Prorocentrum_minimum.AAC.2
MISCTTRHSKLDTRCWEHHHIVWTPSVSEEIHTLSTPYGSKQLTILLIQSRAKCDILSELTRCSCCADLLQLYRTGLLTYLKQVDGRLTEFEFDQLDGCLAFFFVSADHFIRRPHQPLTAVPFEQTQRQATIQTTSVLPRRRQQHDQGTRTFRGGGGAGVVLLRAWSTAGHQVD